MEDMTKYQFILLVLLVSFITALVTGIVSVALINQAPPPVTQTIQKVVEKTVETIQKPLEVDEQKELELAALARDVLVGDITNRVSPAVVSIASSKSSQTGTGFIVAEDGYIVTAKSVVADQNAEYSIVLIDGDRLSVKSVVRDPLENIGILKIDLTDSKKLPVIKLGNSDLVKTGNTVMAIGVSADNYSTLSTGVVSSVSKISYFAHLIRTDATINFDNSGGPLLNLKGEAIGLNIFGEGATGAIGINLVKKDLAEAKEIGKISYPSLGVRYTPVTSAMQEENKLKYDYGVMVAQGANGELAVEKGGAADKAGIIFGDVIFEFDGVKVDEANTLQNLIYKKKAGDKVVIRILRQGKEMALEVVLGEVKD